MNKHVVILGSAALGALRIWGVKHEAYQAVAHLWWMWLFATWYTGSKLTDWDWRKPLGWPAAWETKLEVSPHAERIAWAIILLIVETIMGVFIPLTTYLQTL